MLSTVCGKSTLVMQVVEIGLGEHIELPLTEDRSREDHYGVMEVTELFEDDRVSLCKIV